MRKLAKPRCTYCHRVLQAIRYQEEDEIKFCSYEHAVDWYKTNDPSKIGAALHNTRGNNYV